jgi:dipeptidyl-peptidase-4
MKPITFAPLAILVFSSVAAAQDKLLTVDEIFSPDSKVRVDFSGTPIRLVWAADGASFREVRNGALSRINAVTGDATPFHDATRYKNALMAAGVSEEEAVRMSNAISLQFNKDESAILFTHSNDLWLYNASTGTARRLTNTPDKDEREADFSPDGKWVSFVRGNNLYISEVGRSVEKPLTRDGGEKIHNGYLDWVYEEELYGRGQKRAYWWSPDSKYITFLRLDETPVPRFVLTNDIVNDQVVETTYYPQAGDPNPFVTLGITAITRSSAPRFVDLSRYKPDDLLIARVTWTPDSRTVMMTIRNSSTTDRRSGSLHATAGGISTFTTATRRWSVN